MEEIAEAVRREVGEAAGDALRVVSYFEPTGGAVVYMREDVREQYSERADEKVLDQLRLESTAKPAYESLFGGDLESTTRVFSKTLVTTFPTGNGEGLLLSLDKYGPYDYVDVVDRVQEVVESRT